MSANAYAPYLKGWVKAMGTKPAVAHYDAAEALGARPGSKVAFAIALYLRPEGATSGQVVMAVGGPQLNKARELVEAGKLKRVDMPPNDAGHTVYHFTVKAKAAKPAKARKVNAKAPGTTPAAKPASDAGNGNGAGDQPAVN